MEKLYKRVESVKIYLSVALMIFGCVMIMMGFWVSPIGVIDNSVLIVFGEISTFVGSVFGISMLYSTRHKQLENDIRKRLDGIEDGRIVNVQDKEKGGD